MKTRGAWMKVVMSVGVTILVSSLLLFAVSRETRKRLRENKAGLSRVAASETPRLAVKKNNAKWLEAYGKLPLSFEQNQGQTAREVRYVSRGSGYELFLTPQEAVLALRPKMLHDLSPLHRIAYLRSLRKTRPIPQMTAIRMHLEGANPEPQIVGTDLLSTKVNYFIGGDPKKWHTDVPSFARVKYVGVYPGVDLVFYGNQRRLEYDFIVAPGADPRAIAFDVSGTRKMAINAHGDVVLSVSGGEVQLQKPVVYQNVKGERREVAGNYTVERNHRVTFRVGSYDRSEPLILDPVLNYSTYLGGGAADLGSGIAVDASGNAVIAGQTFSTDFPAGARGAVVAAPAANLGAAFVAQLNPAGTQLLYSTYLAGSTTSGGDIGFAVAVDPSGKVYVAGTTFSVDFPTTSTAFIPQPLATNVNGATFLTKLDPALTGNSSMLYSTYLAGTGGDFANAVAADAGGNAYVAGLTDSTDYPTKNPFQSTRNNAVGTAFLTRIDTTQSGAASLIYSTYLGGTGVNSANFLLFGDSAFGVAADSSHIAYVTGQTSSNDSSLTTANAYQRTPPVANTKASVFVSKIDTTLSGAASLVYSTYLAGSTSDQGNAIALGPSNVAYVTGTTSSTDYPLPGATTGAFDTAGAVAGKAFITLVDTTQSGVASVTYSTFLGGTGGDTGFGIRVDGSGNAYVTGTTSSTDFIGTATLQGLNAFQTVLSNTVGSPFLVKLHPGGAGSADLVYATYFGGSGDGTNADQGFGIAIDAASPPSAYLTGQTSSTNMPVLSFLPTGGALKPPSDAFVAKMTLPALVISPRTLAFGIQPVNVTSIPQTVTVTNNGSATVTFTSIATTGANSADFVVASDTCSPSVVAGASCTVTVTFKPSVAAAESATLAFTDNDANSPQGVSLSGTGSATAPGVGLAPTSLAFGGQMLTTTSAAKTVTLTNTGNGPLTISSIAAFPGDFVATSSGATACPIGPATLAAAGTCTISVTFAPAALGARPGTLTITDNAGGNPHTIPLSGSGWDFTLTAPATGTVTAAAPLHFNATMTPLGGFNQSVGLTCTGAPAGTTCTVVSPVMAADGVTAQTAQVTVTTTAMMVPPRSIPTPPLSMRQLVPLILALMLLLLLPRTKRLRLRLGMGVAMLMLVVLAGCSGSNKKPPVNATLTITGTSNGTAGTVNHTATVALTVN